MSSSTKNSNPIGQSNRLRRRQEARNYDETSTSWELDEGNTANNTEGSVVVVPSEDPLTSAEKENPPKWFKEMEARMVTLIKEHLAPEIEERLMLRIEERLDERFRKQKEEIKKELVDITKHLVEEQAKRITDIETQCNQRLKEQEVKSEKWEEQISILTQEVTALKNLVGTHEKKEAERLSHNLIFSRNTLPRFTEGENAVNVAINLVRNNYNLNVNPQHISSANRMGKPPTDGSQDKRRLIVRLTNKVIKNEIMLTNVKNRIAGLFINEELTKPINELYYRIRKLRKENPDNIKILYTRDGVIKAKKTKEGTLYSISTNQELEDFLHKVGL